MKLKYIISSCCVVTALWTEIQGMDGTNTQNTDHDPKETRSFTKPKYISSVNYYNQEIKKPGDKSFNKLKRERKSEITKEWKNYELSISKQYDVIDKEEEEGNTERKELEKKIEELPIADIAIDNLFENIDKIPKDFISADRNTSIGNSIIRAVNCDYQPDGRHLRPSGGNKGGRPVYQEGNYSDWPTYLSPYGFSDNSKMTNIFNDVGEETVVKKIKELEEECGKILNDTDMSLFKISMGDSNTNDTFNISMHFKKEDATPLNQGKPKFVGNIKYPHSYNKEVVVDIHCNYLTDNFKVDQTIFEEYIDYCKFLIVNGLTIPPQYDLIAQEPQNYGVWK